MTGQPDASHDKPRIHQSSHSSLAPFAGGARLPPFPIADVPIELFSAFLWSAVLERSSQNALLLSSKGTWR